MKNISLFVLLVLFTFSCNNASKSDYSVAKKTKEATEHPGKKLMETNCYVCHNPTASHDERIAPPMIAIKKHYINDTTTKEAFIAAMQTWVKNPNAEDAKMFGAVKRFGLMPKQAFPEKTIAQIADYMFNNNIDQPTWFEAHFNEEKGKHNGQERGNSMGEKKSKV